MIFRAYRYGPDYEGLKGKVLDPDRFEWVLVEKSKSGVDKLYPIPDGEKAVHERLARLGY